MFVKYNLESIKIFSIVDITLIQRDKDVTDKMREFASLILSGHVPDAAEELEWALCLYADETGGYLGTVARFIDTCQSIRDKGYKVRRINVADSYWAPDTERIKRPSDALVYPTIALDVDGTIRGGNHRAAVLYSLGVVNTPVIYTTQVDLGDDRAAKKEADNIYMEQYNQAIEDFKGSQEWRDYKSTNCYRQSFGRGV